ncbi:MAG: hypothetical protein AB1486_15990 [Planctomycetota bacterium]
MKSPSRGGGWARAKDAQATNQTSYGYAADLVPSGANERADVFLHDRPSGETIRVSIASDGTEANDGSLTPAISADGRFSSFSTSASTLVEGDTNLNFDVFVRGPELTLQAEPVMVSAGQGLAFTTYKGGVANPASLWAVALNGIPVFARLALGTFNPRGLFALEGVVPGGLGGLWITFQSYCLGWSGDVAVTNEVTVYFQ